MRVPAAHRIEPFPWLPVVVTSTGSRLRLTPPLHGLVQGVQQVGDIASEFVDHGVSGAKCRKDRPQFNALLHGVARREFDMVAWSVDRLGRSLQDLVAFLADLQSKKIDLYLHQQAVDTSTPSGKAMFGAEGKTLGRPRTDPDVEAKVRELAAGGMGKGRIARTLGIGVSVTRRILAG